jgi:hypothetical protein
MIEQVQSAKQLRGAIAFSKRTGAITFDERFGEKQAIAPLIKVVSRELGRSLFKYGNKNP